MSGVWLISHFAMWLVIAIMLMGFVAMARQIGLLHRRLPPVGARGSTLGPGVGERAPVFAERSQQGKIVTLGLDEGRRTLLLFVSPGCRGCEMLAPALRSFANAERSHLDTILVSIAGHELMNVFVETYGLADLPLILSSDLPEQYGVTASPYGVLVDEEGVVRSKGAVNHLEHLESLVNALNLELPTVPSSAELEHALEAGLSVVEAPASVPRGAL